MSELPDDITRALAELPRERQPDPALEDRVVRAVLGRAAAAASGCGWVARRPRRRRCSS